MIITLTLNYIQRIEKRLVMLYYKYSDTVFAIGRFNDAKDKDAFLRYSCQIVTSAYHTFVTYLFAARQAQANDVTLVTQLKLTITIGKLHLRWWIGQFSLLYHNLFTEL